MSTTNKGQTVTGAVCWTRHAAQTFVVLLWALRVAVTHVVGVETDNGAPASEKSWTCVVAAHSLILVARTVEHAVTEKKDRHAVDISSWATKVCVWTVGNSFQREKFPMIKVHYDGWRRIIHDNSHFFFFLKNATLLVCFIDTLFSSITLFDLLDALFRIENTQRERIIIDTIDHIKACKSERVREREDRSEREREKSYERKKYCF